MITRLKKFYFYTWIISMMVCLIMSSFAGYKVIRGDDVMNLKGVITHKWTSIEKEGGEVHTAYNMVIHPDDKNLKDYHTFVEPVVYMNNEVGNKITLNNISKSIDELGLDEPNYNLWIVCYGLCLIFICILGIIVMSLMASIELEL